jgi:hypothetical protein
MTLQTIAVLAGLGAIVVAVAATRYDVSPWRIFGLASVAGIVTLGELIRAGSQECGISGGVGEQLGGVAAVLGLTLYAAAALGAVIDGVRLGKAGEPWAAISRCLACPLASAVSVAILFYAFLAALFHCIGD